MQQIGKGDAISVLKDLFPWNFPSIKIIPLTVAEIKCIIHFLLKKNIYIYILEKKWEYNEAVHQLFIDFKKAYDSVRREVLYNILIEFGVPKKLVRLVKMCLTETYSRVRVGKNVSDMFPITNGLKQRFSIAIAFQLCLGVCH